MASNAVVALAKATTNGETLLGQNCDRPHRKCQPLSSTPGRALAAGEKVKTQYLEVPQVRQVYRVLASQPDGCLGYDYGLNEHQVAVAWTSLRPALPAPGPGLTGPDLVRLVLERSRTALQAVEVAASLIERYGSDENHIAITSPEGDNAFLIADPKEAYAMESAGRHWVYQEVREVRASTNARVVRQDWDRISQGLASHAIEQGWWPGDGSKLDFAGALKEDLGDQSDAMHRWGRATLLLQEQNGHIDVPFLRILLSDHHVEGGASEDGRGLESDPRSLCQHWGTDGNGTSASLISRLSSDPASLPMAWCAFGPPCANVYFPIFLDGDVPSALVEKGPEPEGNRFHLRVHFLMRQLPRDPESCIEIRTVLDRLQARFDQEAEEFAMEGAGLKKRDMREELQRQATFFMQYHLEQFEGALAELLAGRQALALSL